MGQRLTPLGINSESIGLVLLDLYGLPVLISTNNQFGMRFRSSPYLLYGYFFIALPNLISESQKHHHMNPCLGSHRR
jgi:hypothetical protein